MVCGNCQEEVRCREVFTKVHKASGMLTLAGFHLTGPYEGRNYWGGGGGGGGGGGNGDVYMVAIQNI